MHAIKIQRSVYGRITYKNVMFNIKYEMYVWHERVCLLDLLSAINCRWANKRNKEFTIDAHVYRLASEVALSQRRRVVPGVFAAIRWRKLDGIAITSRL